MLTVALPKCSAATWLEVAAELCKESPRTYFVRGPFVLRDPLGVLAALRGRELGHPDLTVSSAHGQGGVPTVRQELSLRTQEKGGQQEVSK